MYTDTRYSIESKYKNGNRLLFSRNSACLQDLIRLMELQNHRTLVMWAFDCVQEPLSLFEAKYPHEPRPRKALELCKAWAKGLIKMPEAKSAILSVHAVAKDFDDKEFIAIAHAIGHACATVHVKTHALGLVFYELTAVVFHEGLEKCDLPVNRKIDHYKERLLYWQKNIDAEDVPWVKFLIPRQS